MIPTKILPWILSISSVLLSLFFFASTSIKPEHRELDKAELDEFLQAAQSEIGMPAISCAVLKDGKLIYQYEKGLANVEHEVELSPKTVYPLYSLTKPFIAVGVFALIEKGQLELDDSVSKFVPDLPDAWKEIQVQHLLAHSSGLPDMVGNNPYELRDLDEVAAKARVYALPLRFTAGEKYEYNQTNFWLLKEIIESTSPA